MPNQYNQEEFQDQLVLAGLSSSLEPIDLIREYQKLLVEHQSNSAHFRAEQLTKKLEATAIKVSTTDNIVRGQKAEIAELKEKNNWYVINSAEEHGRYKDLAANLLKYAAHKENCGYIESVEIGKIDAKMTEKDHCDCGYVKVVEEVMNRIEKITGEKPKDQ